jgi:hypothetical protein
MEQSEHLQRIQSSVAVVKCSSTAQLSWMASNICGSSVISVEYIRFDEMCSVFALHLQIKKKKKKHFLCLVLSVDCYSALDVHLLVSYLLQLFENEFQRNDVKQATRETTVAGTLMVSPFPQAERT